MSFYLKNKKGRSMSMYLDRDDLVIDLENEIKELRELFDLVAGCTDLNETWYGTDEDNRPLLKKYIKRKFLP